MESTQIILKKVRVHNLKNVNLKLPKNKLIVFTGVSGSGKSSLAFDTIYTEGQRRYLESLSSHARRYMGDLPKPDADEISGISPTIAIEQKTVGRTPRSTVGTMTGIYDHLRVLFARIGVPHCPVSHEPVAMQSREKIIHQILQFPENAKLIFLSPYAKSKKAEFKEDFIELLRKGFTKVRVDGDIIDLQEQESLNPNIAHNVDIVVDRIKISPDNKSRVIESVNLALDIGKGFFSVLDVDANQEKNFSQHAYSPKSGLSYGPLDPTDFSFNHPSGMCETCDGLGITQEFVLEKIIDFDKSIAEDCCKIASSFQTVRYGNIYQNLAKIYKFDVHTPWKKLPEKAKHVFLYGTEEKWTSMKFVHPVRKIKWTEYVKWQGVLHEAHLRYLEAKSDSYKKKMEDLMSEAICPKCHGARIRPYPAATRFNGKTIQELTHLTLLHMRDFFENLHLDPDDLLIGEELIKEIKVRLKYLTDVGVHYLTLDRSAPTLSGGESQRIRLASHIGAGLVGSIYILDEPSIGLHPRDHHKLINTLGNLKDAGNTLIVVEHDKETIEKADLIVDVGPKAGKYGGEILAVGTIEEIIASKKSVTGEYLSGQKSIKIPKRRKLPKEKITVKKASHHNLQNVNVDIPLHGLICVTGVSGSGKSSLISDTLYPYLANTLNKANLKIGKVQAIEGAKHLDKVIFVDQSPIGRTPRSNPGTYTKLFDDIRLLFSGLPESKIRGYTPGHFSFNVKEGSCSYCHGLGTVKIDMDFMEDVWVDCRQCKGKRFDSDILSITFNGMNIFDVLQMDVEKGLEVFVNIPTIFKKLKLLSKVGLNYLQLGQPSTTLSGGEAQRIKLAKELVRPQTGKTLYILDEPTTGLHFQDIERLIDVLQELVSLNNTVLVVEHNMDLIKSADWIIDLGPEAGDAGGTIIGANTPEKIATLPTPTGKELKKVLHEKPVLSKKSNPTQEGFQKNIVIENAHQNNLKNVDVTIPRNAISIFTGPSGSGKTSLAFDTIFAEGQRRYIESLPPFARQIVKQMPKPKVEKIEGLSPTIAIEQKKGAVNPRSTVGTLTEIYDHLRILYAHFGTAYCPDTGEEIKTISKEYVVKKVSELPEKEKIHVLAPLKAPVSEPFEEFLQKLNRQGFLRIRLNGNYHELDEDIPYDKHKKNEIYLVIDRLMVQKSSEKRLFEAISKALQITDSIVVIATKDKDYYYNLAFAVEKTGKSYPKITPQSFSFNASQGMCLECQGIGSVYGMNLQNYSKIMNLSIIDFARVLFKELGSKKSIDLMLDYFESINIDPYLPLKKLSKEDLAVVLSDGKNASFQTKEGFFVSFKGFQATLAKAAKIALQHIKEALVPHMFERTCPSCNGKRLNPLSSNVKIKGVSLPELVSYSIEKTLYFFQNLEVVEPFLQETVSLIIKKLQFLQEIGLDYLALNRSAPTLSGGEMQRIRLAKQLGSSLTNCIYVLDEPTIGLHPHNSDQLFNSLSKLKDLNNTLLIVEHDPDIIKKCDYIYDFGPHAGAQGGKIVASGTIDQIMTEGSLTGQYLSGQKKIGLPQKRRTFTETIQVENAHVHNLKNVNVSIPLQVMTAVTGVSGSGKSSLMHHILKPGFDLALKDRRKKQVEVKGATIKNVKKIDKLIVIDQNPIGSTIRADILTYSDLSSPVRSHYASMPQAKAKGLLPKHFSYNHKKGMCRTCWGLGYRIVNLQFMPSVKVQCEACKGYRLNPISLEVSYKGKHLGQILQLTVKEARTFFESIPQIVKKLDLLTDVGLDYLTLGQDLVSLSGGEAQRLRLSKELSKRSTGSTLYLIDEPSTGLHFDDLEKLLKIFHKLADKKNTLLIIEHNLDLIANCDYIIDMGPQAGEKGGEVVAIGTPEEIAKNKRSVTASHLKKRLQDR
ncbi:MAG: excinuclease ABC subunit A [Chlamydiae bacterium CG10_big_fil_rev_8_21_14_0_10_35_9]|nr:MAG: excinuclease ABC subunit A [Chlamydiae bacterium CG10_big_fil_rev_8_21_14_0_10_35_9]